MIFAVSAVFFLVFATNVALGSFANASFMGDVPEMIVLFLTAVTFVLGILREENRRNAEDKNREI